MNNDDRHWPLALLLGSGVALAARRRGALSLSGAIGAASVGTAVFGAGGPRASTLLLLFFGSSTALSRSSRRSMTALSRSSRRSMGDARDAGNEREGPRRTAAQVLANGGIPAALALLGLRTWSPRVIAAYAGALAAANADTWATEIGRRSRTPPRVITTGKPAPPGVSGAVSPLGTLASLAGASLIGVAFALCYRARLRTALGIVAGGALGASIDSLLGGTLQAVYRCRACGKRTEDRTHAHGQDAPTLTLVRGLPYMTNDTVNLCASLTGAIAGALLGRPGPVKSRPSSFSPPPPLADWSPGP